MTTSLKGEDDLPEIQSGTATIQCEKCATVHKVPLFTNQVDSGERQMGAEVQYDTTGKINCRCGNRITYTLSEWEYPVGQTSHTEGPKVIGGKLLAAT